MTLRLLAVGLATAGCAVVCADGPAAPSKSDAQAAFDRLKTLAGRWEARNDQHERLNLELIAGGTALVERETADGRPEMLTVYHLDGDRLLLTHYCMAGNQPRMQLRAFDAGTGALSFDFVDAGNLANPNAGHMHNAKIRLVDQDHLATEWQFFENGTAKMKEATEYTRVR